MAKKRKRGRRKARPQADTTRPSVPSLQQLLGLPIDALSRLDIAEANLVCAGGLPGIRPLARTRASSSSPRATTGFGR
jgi:hypothetical protein